MISKRAEDRNSILWRISQQPENSIHWRNLTFQKRAQDRKNSIHLPRPDNIHLCAAFLSHASAVIVTDSMHLCLGCCQRVNCSANHQSILHVCTNFMRGIERNACICICSNKVKKDKLLWLNGKRPFQYILQT